MSVDVKLWGATFTQGAIPVWPCPECRDGRLVLDGKVRLMEPEHSRRNHSHEAWEPDWVDERFVFLMKCSNSNCGEVVVVSGDTEVVEDWGYEGPEIITNLRPRSIFPAPPIMTVPDEAPKEVKDNLRLAFQLFWSDLGASANRIRTSVERLLDDFKVAKSTIDPKRKRRVFLPLASRIDKFKKQYPDHGESLEALRHIGNVGTHSKVTRQSVLAGFEVYEAALAEIYSKRSKKLQQMRKKLIKKKGKL